MSDGRHPAGRPWAFAAGLLLTVTVATSLFVPTVVGYVSYDQVKTADVTVEDAAVADDGTALAVTVAFSNPTRAPVVVVDAETVARVDGTAVTRVAGVSVQRTTVDPGETGAVEFRLPMRDGRLDTARSGIRDGSLTVTGKVWVEVRGAKNSVILR